MRSFRTLAAGLALTALLPAVGAAQEGRLFKDAWFWGVNTGVMTFWTTRVSHAPAPMIGVEWLITRSRVGLYLSAENAWFDRQTSVDDYPDMTTTREVHIENMHRASASLLAFPKSFGILRPYAGIGFALNVIQTATPVGPVTQTDADGNTVKDYIADRATRTAPLILGGVQAQYSRFSVFGQASVMNSANRFLLNNNPTVFVQGGIRYNVGSAIERDR